MHQGEEFLPRSKVQSLLGVSASWLKAHKRDGRLIEGIHWYRLGPNHVLYNLPLLRDFIVNSSSPAQHQRAIEKFLRSLPSSQP